MVKVPLVIPRKQAFACRQRDRIILPTLMLILPGKPPYVLVRFWWPVIWELDCLRAACRLLVSMRVMGWAAIFVGFVPER